MLTIDQKFEHAKIARSRSYSPYSNFKVGAVVIMDNDEVVYGCNVENASYGLCNCAERNAIFSAISLGLDPKMIKEMVIIAGSERPVSPCGACRQVMAEFLNSNTKITLFNLNKDYIEITLGELLPYSFDQGDLNGK